MKRGTKWSLSRRGANRSGLTVVSASIVLAAVVIGTGVVGYVVLNDVAGTHSHSSSTKACSPPNLPQCQGAANATDEGAFASVPAALSVR